MIRIPKYDSDCSQKETFSHSPTVIIASGAYKLLASHYRDDVRKTFSCFATVVILFCALLHVRLLHAIKDTYIHTYIQVLCSRLRVVINHGIVYLLNYTILAVCLFLNHVFSIDSSDLVTC